MRSPNRTKETPRCVEYNWQADEDSGIKLTCFYHDNRKRYMATLRPFVYEFGAETMDLTDVLYVRYSIGQGSFSQKTFTQWARDTRDNLDGEQILAEMPATMHEDFKKMLSRIPVDA